MNRRYNTPLPLQFVIVAGWLLTVGAIAVFTTVVAVAGWAWHWWGEFTGEREIV